MRCVLFIFFCLDGPKDPWSCVLSLPRRFVGDPASLARDNILEILDNKKGGWVLPDRDSMALHEVTPLPNIFSG